MIGVNNAAAIPNGFCLSCRTKTSLVCHRCGDFYCSKECQLMDWQRHRYICFPIPPLVQPTACSALALMDISSTPPLSSSNITQKEEVNNSDICVYKAQDAGCESVSLTESDQKNNSSHITDPIGNCNTKVDGKNKNDHNIIIDVTFTKPTSAGNINNKVECNNKHDSKLIIEENIISTKPTGNTNTKNNQQSKKLSNSDLIHPPVVDIPSGSTVYITRCVSANRLMVRGAGESAEKAYSEICEKVNMLSKNLLKKANIKFPEYAVAKFDGLYHRVKVMDKKPVLRLLLLDEGIIKFWNQAELREISSELLELPRCSWQVQLKGIPNFTLNKEVTDFLQQFEGDKFIASYVTNGPMELRSLETQKSLNAQILEYCSDMEVYGNQSQNKKMPTANQANEVKALKILKDQIPVKFNQTQEAIIEEVNRKNKGLIKAMELMLNNDQTLTDNNHGIESDLKQIVGGHHSPKIDQHLKETAILSNPMTNGKSEDKLNELNIKTEPAEKLQNNSNVRRYSLEEMKTLNEKQDILETTVPFLPSIKKYKKTKASTEHIIAPGVEPLFKPPFEIRRLTVSNKKGIDAIIADNVNVSRGILAAFDSTYLGNMSELRFRLSQFKDLRPYTPKLKEYVIAKIKNKWCRAKVMEIKQNVYSVMDIELANITSVSEEDICRYPADLDIPCYTSVCLIDAFPHQLSKGQTEYLQKTLLLNGRLHIDRVSYLQDMALITCKTLIEELAKIV